MQNITLRYGQVEVVTEVSFFAEDGITALFGANGAGKTSLLRSVSGLKPPAKGNIFFEGKSLLGLEPHAILKRGLVHVPEGRHIFSAMTVEENLLLGAYALQNRGSIPDLLRQVYDLFPRLKERRKQQGGTLSGGEQQMLALGRALMSRPKMLLLDEPTMGLSPLMVQEIAAVIRSLKEQEIPILLVEQNASFALDLADRGYVIRNGKICLSGNVSDLRNDPAVIRAYLAGDELL